MTDTVLAVAPQRRGLVPPDHAARILEAAEQRAQAEQAYRDAVVDALRAGASYRELVTLTGTALSTIQKWKAEADQTGR